MSAGEARGQGQGLRASLEDTCPISARNQLQWSACPAGGCPWQRGTPPLLGLSFPAVTGEGGVGQSESPWLLPGSTRISDLREAWPGKRALPEGGLRPEGQGLAFLLRLSSSQTQEPLRSGLSTESRGGVSRGRAKQAEGGSGGPCPIPHLGLHLLGPFQLQAAAHFRSWTPAVAWESPLPL